MTKHSALAGKFSSSPLDQAILTSLEALARHVRRMGYDCQAYSKKSLEILASLPEEKKTTIHAQARLLVHAILLSADDEEAKIHPEKALVDKALDFYNLEIKDAFWKTLEHDDIIEIYNTESIQIFRTLNFFKTCGYSLLDLLTTEWYMLWERPSFVMQRMMEIAKDMIVGQKDTVEKVNIPTHVLKEVYNANDSFDFVPRSALIEFGYICPVYRKGTSLIAGLAVTCKSRLVTTGVETHQIAML
jgi:hypothetical protein